MTAAVPDPCFRDQLAEALDDIAGRLQPRLDESDAEWVMSTFIAPLFGNGDATDLAEVLAKHRSLPLRISWAACPGCSCGWLYPADSHGGERLAAFEQHRANALLPLVEARVQAAANQRAAEAVRHAAETAPVVRFDNGYPVRAVPVSDLLSFAAALASPAPAPRAEETALLDAAQGWILRHSSQPDGDRWRDNPDHLAWAAENLLCDLKPWLVEAGS